MIDKQTEEDLEKLTLFTNEYIYKFADTIDPQNYKHDVNLFVRTSITSPSLLSATIIDKIAETFSLDRNEVLKEFIKKLELALRWVDHKKVQ